MPNNSYAPPPPPPPLASDYAPPPPPAPLPGATGGITYDGNSWLQYQQPGAGQTVGGTTTGGPFFNGYPAPVAGEPYIGLIDSLLIMLSLFLLVVGGTLLRDYCKWKDKGCPPDGLWNPPAQKEN